MGEKPWHLKTEVTDYMDDVERILYKLFPEFSKEDHDDVVSEVFYRLVRSGYPIPKLRNFPDFKKPRDAYNFAYTTVLNTAITFKTKLLKRNERLPLFEECIEDLTSEIEDACDVKIIIESLPPNQQYLVYQALEQPREYQKAAAWEKEYLIQCLGISSSGFIN